MSVIQKGNLRLTVVLFVTFFSTTAAQVTCVTPSEIGELRVKNSKKCVDIGGNSGAGNVATYLCDGHADQKIIICSDGTIRNEQANYCFSAGWNGDGNVESTICEVYPNIPDYQKWGFGRTKMFTDTGGIVQVAREIINVKSGLCLDVYGTTGDGNVGTYQCEDKDDQYFYIRSRGAPRAHGRLQVEKSGLCLDAQNGYNVEVHNCENKVEQQFRLYENGEVINVKSGKCLDVYDTSGSGNVGLYACEDLQDQMWSQPNNYCNGDYCSLVNKKSQKCLDVDDKDATESSNVGTYTCEALADQRFQWVSENWERPSAKWVKVGCHNGPIEMEVSNTVAFSKEITESMSVDISSTIEAGVFFGSVSVSASVSQSLAVSWQYSFSETKKITFTCEYYDNGATFTEGCMWQLQVETKSLLSGDILKWEPLNVKCTSNNMPPGCPPFTKCKDESCTMCE